MSNKQNAQPAVAPPNWYVDPQDSAQQRWWSGAAWTEHTRSNLPGVNPQEAYAPVDTGRKPTRSQRERELRRNNGYAYAGALVALISLVYDPLAITSAVAVVFASIGLGTARGLRAYGVKYTGFAWSIAGLAIGVFSGIAYLANIFFQFKADL